MAKKKMKRSSRPIVIAHLEKVSRGIFDKYQRQITDMIRGHYGVYALYRHNKLYYIGLATDLKRRIRQHLGDRHKSNWSHFGLYIFKKEGQIKELESLLLRIADPAGNAVRGKLRGSKDLLPQLKSDVKKQQQIEIEELFSRYKVVKKKAKKRTSKATKEGNVLKGLLRNGQGLYANYKGKSYKAIFYTKRGIKLGGKFYLSPSGAAKVIIERGAVNGWNFWKYKDKSGDLKAIKSLRSKTPAGERG